ncbi:MAG: ABC transporter permease [Planctomycetia bacterium]|nr:ABC transporter permease [Planctomycetia bacterium]
MPAPANAHTADGPLADWLAGTRKIDLWGTLAWYDTILRYRRSMLGPLWITLSMGIMLLGMGPLYSGLFDVPLRQFYPHLALGIIFWHFLVASINDGCQVFIAAAAYLKQGRFSLSVFVWRSLAKQVILLAHHMVLYLPIAVWAGVGWSPRQLLFVPGFVVVLVNLHATAIILGILTARFRDVTQIVASAMQFLMFLTPVFWMPDRLPPRTKFILLNPLAQMLDVMRLPLLGGQPAPGTWWFLVGWTILTVTLAAMLFTAFRRRVVYWI